MIWKKPHLHTWDNSAELHDLIFKKMIVEHIRKPKVIQSCKTCNAKRELEVTLGVTVLETKIIEVEHD